MFLEMFLLLEIIRFFAVLTWKFYNESQVTEIWWSKDKRNVNNCKTKFYFLQIFWAQAQTNVCIQHSFFYLF